MAHDYVNTGLSLKQHPITFLRPQLERRRVTPCGALPDTPTGRTITIAGLCIIRQRPGSASGVTFVTIEDETGIANLVVWPKVFDRDRKLILHRPLLFARGKVQRDDGDGKVIHVVVQRFLPIDPRARAPWAVEAFSLTTLQNDLVPRITKN